MPKRYYDYIYTTGAYLEPVQLSDGSWKWVVRNFENDTFDDNGDLVSPRVEAETEDNLLPEESD
jgi:hypothetical protein